jgi:PAS domain S-box-containing protein
MIPSLNKKTDPNTGAEHVAELEKEVFELTQKLGEKNMELRDVREASANIRQDLDQEQGELRDSRKATANLLEDIESDREKIRATQARDEAILGSIGVGLVATDRSSKIILVNGAFERILGWDESEVKGRMLYEVLEALDEFGKVIPVAERLINKLLNGEATSITTVNNHRYKRKDGTFIPLAFTAAPILDGPLRLVIGAVGVFRDITAEKELDRVKNEFISIASHQLRTPLTAIQWVIERFTKKETLTPKGMEYLSDIHISAKRLTAMVDLMLNLSRIEAGTIGIATEAVDVIALVKIFLLEITPLRDKKELKVIFEVYPAELVVKTDKNSLRNIIQSLVSNSIEYTPVGGSIDIAVQKKDETFVIHVKDTGIGIPIAEQSQIFQKFVRATNAKLYKTDGTGIGLYVAEWSVRRLGGKIWFESNEGMGSTFHVELPLESQPQKKQNVPVSERSGEKFL